jgi:phage terminase small subunit
VVSVDAGHFRKSDLPLLTQYSAAIDLADQAQKHLDAEGAVIDGKTSPWIAIQEKAVRNMVALSMRLRLSPQSRLDRKTAGSNSRKGSGSLGVDALSGVNDE